jgi:8-oxo-dGTP pyrophosphatase MutT (NUDIX family)
MNIALLKELIQKDLPGYEAQMLMAPPFRRNEIVIKPNYKIGAVAILLFQQNEEWNFLLMQRTVDNSVHSGQISLPGGKYDETDFTTTYTSLRELHEEMGIPIFSYQYIGALSSLYIPPSNFMVYPHVLLTQETINIIESKGEVIETIIVPVSELLNQSLKGTMLVGQSDNRENVLEVPIYNFQNKYKVWGATAIILSELEQLFHKLT